MSKEEPNKFDVQNLEGFPPDQAIVIEGPNRVGVDEAQVLAYPSISDREIASEYRAARVEAARLRNGQDQRPNKLASTDDDLSYMDKLAVETFSAADREGRTTDELFDLRAQRIEAWALLLDKHPPTEKIRQAHPDVTFDPKDLGIQETTVAKTQEEIIELEAALADSDGSTRFADIRSRIDQKKSQIAPWLVVMADLRGLATLRETTTEN
jgi:hypothetical protein